jgi:hypothetical protein
MAYRNQNLVQMNPLSLLLLPGLAALARGRAGRMTQRAATVVALLSLVGLALKLVPGTGQVNGPVIALALPAHLGVLAAVLRLRRAGAS